MLTEWYDEFKKSPNEILKNKVFDWGIAHLILMFGKRDIFSSEELEEKFLFTTHKGKPNFDLYFLMIGNAKRHGFLIEFPKEDEKTKRIIACFKSAHNSYSASTNDFVLEADYKSNRYIEGDYPLRHCFNYRLTDKGEDFRKYFVSPPFFISELLPDGLNFLQGKYMDVLRSQKDKEPIYFLNCTREVFGELTYNTQKWGQSAVDGLVKMKKIKAEYVGFRLILELVK